MGYVLVEANFYGATTCVLHFVVDVDDTPFPDDLYTLSRALSNFDGYYFADDSPCRLSFCVTTNYLKRSLISSTIRTWCTALLACGYIIIPKSTFAESILDIVYDTDTYCAALYI